MKLEKRMYVRTKNGMIAKIIDKRDVSGSLHREEIVFILDNGNKLALHSQKVVKASHNIIDLIEVGDYVNGGIVAEIKKTFIRMNGTKELLFQFIDKDKPEEIKSIVTKEQFESVQYKVGE